MSESETSVVIARAEASPRNPARRRGAGGPDFHSKPRLYVGVAGENLLENFAYRGDRPHRVYRQHLPAMYAALGLPAETKARWSPKAGCSCPCSPGFILTLPEHVQGAKRYGTDYHVTLGASAPKVTENANSARIAYRAGEIIKITEGVA